jgi:hypothetical protein
MKVLSIDVGIKNLAFCLFEKTNDSQHFNIAKWDIINISEKEDTINCCFVDKNVLCNKPAKFKNEDKCYCLKHSKKQQLQIPGCEQKPSFINKQKLQKLYEIADAHNIKYEHKVKKTDLVNLINEYISINYFQNIESKKAADVDLFNIGINIKTKFNKLFVNEGQIDYVIIENQISPIATRMKTIQGMIVQYFIMSNLNVSHIEFISAANKLNSLASATEAACCILSIDETVRNPQSEKPGAPSQGVGLQAGGGRNKMVSEAMGGKGMAGMMGGKRKGVHMLKGKGGA